MNRSSKSPLRRCLGILAVFSISLTAQATHAQYGPYGPGGRVRQDFRIIQQDRFQRDQDLNRLGYDLGRGDWGGVISDLNRLDADQQRFRNDRRRLEYDLYRRNQYYSTYPPNYVQPTQYQYLQQPPVVQNYVQRYQIPAEYAGTAPGYVISYGGANYLTGSDGTMTLYTGLVSR